MMGRIAQVDEARARVLVMKARAFGQFTTGGRGHSAPDMGPRDAASALLLALHMGEATQSGEGVQMLRDLPLDHVKYDPGDGAFRDYEAHSVFLDEQSDRVEHLPMAFAAKLPATLGEALDSLMGRPDAYKNRFDRIEHQCRSALSTVVLSLADESYRHYSWGEDGVRAWQFVFEPEVYSDGDPLGVWTSKTVHCEGLRALRDLIAEGGQH